jgi:hypothetical protein
LWALSFADKLAGSQRPCRIDNPFESNFSGSIISPRGDTRMASRLVAKLIIECAKPVARCVQQGETLPTLVGGLAGGALGACAAFAQRVLLAPGILLGATVGAAFAATIFKRRRPTLGDQSPVVEQLRVGRVVQAWPLKGFSLITGEFKSLTVLLERALYMVRDNDAPWDDVLRKLAEERYSDVPSGDLIRLDDIAFFETGLLDSNSISVFYATADGLRKRLMFLRRTNGGDQLIAGIEQLMGKPFLREQRPVTLSRAIRAPLIWATGIALVFMAIAWVSAAWTANPPPNPVGKAERDPLVDLMIRVGPGPVLLAGPVTLLPFVVWLGYRAWQPPLVCIILAPRGATR